LTTTTFAAPSIPASRSTVAGHFTETYLAQLVARLPADSPALSLTEAVIAATCAEPFSGSLFQAGYNTTYAPSMTPTRIINPLGASSIFPAEAASATAFLDETRAAVEHDTKFGPRSATPQ
jgi:hypothetical protein